MMREDGANVAVPPGIEVGIDGNGVVRENAEPSLEGEHH